MEKTLKFEHNGFLRRMKSMLKVDFRRMFRSKVFYIVVACALLVPVLMTVMMTMMDGMESVNQQTGEITIIEAPESVWEFIGTLPTDNGGAAAGGGMDVMSMCNINMVFMGAAVFICLFISEDFRCGYAKNLFTVRPGKSDYVISKTAAGFVCGALMLVGYFIGTLLGGAISGLSFELVGFSVFNIIMCILAKIFLMLVFISIFVIVSIAAKQRTWLSICGSLGAGMLLFMTVSMITPLNSTAIHLFLCLAGGALFAVGLGAVSGVILNKSSLV